MRSTPVEVPAAARARWLAELAETLGQAKQLIDRLRVSGLSRPMIEDLELQIEFVEREVESLRGSRSARMESNPDWTIRPPWQESPPRDPHTP